MATGTSMVLSYKRLFSGPLDVDTVFNTINEAIAYANSPTSYINQVIGVTTDNGSNKAYIINSNKELKALALQDDVNSAQLVYSLPDVGEEGTIYVLYNTGSGYIWFDDKWLKVFANIVSTMEEANAMHGADGDLIPIYAENSIVSYFVFKTSLNTLKAELDKKIPSWDDMLD